MGGVNGVESQYELGGGECNMNVDYWMVLIREYGSFFEPQNRRAGVYLTKNLWIGIYF